MKKTRFATGIIACVSSIILIGSCQKEQGVSQGKNDVYTDNPNLPAIPYVYSGNSEAATLGRILFYDKKLSLNNSVSCGSCHKQEFGFADNRQFSVGLEGKLTSRNTSAIIHSGGTKFWDGRANNFADAVLQPLVNHTEMKIFSLEMLPEKLQNISYYPALFLKAYGDNTITVGRIKSALVEFLQNFTAPDSKYDLSIQNGGNNLTAFEKQGHDLFFGKGKCVQCHTGTNFEFNTGMGQNIGLDMNYTDKGRFDVTKSPEDEGKFIAPPLKNIALTAPYMHDGRFKTLREVIDHYSERIHSHPNLSFILRDGSSPLHLALSENEKRALEFFLHTLTSTSFINDKRLSDPFRKKGN